MSVRTPQYEYGRMHLDPVYHGNSHGAREKSQGFRVRRHIPRSDGWHVVLRHMIRVVAVMSLALIIAASCSGDVGAVANSSRSRSE